MVHQKVYPLVHIPLNVIEFVAYNYSFAFQSRMEKLFKSLKDSKRRIRQQIKVAAGRADMTTDAKFDLEYRRFMDVENNLKALSAQCVSLIHNVDTWCDTNRKLADELLRFTQKSEIQTEDMNTYKDAINNLHIALQSEYDFTRRAIICVLRAHIITRIELLLRGDFAEANEVIKARKNIVMDYDSHRDRCNDYERKGDSSNAERFRMKMDHDHEMMQEHTQYLEKRFEELIAVGASILSNETATLVACEMFLVERQHNAMETIAASFPKKDIQDVIASIEHISDRIQAGENVEASYVAPEIPTPSFPYVEPPSIRPFVPPTARSTTSHETVATPSFQQANPSDPSSSSTNGRRPIPPVPPVPPGMETNVGKTVRVMYTLNTGNSGELVLAEGDLIEVLREDPSGWWEGRLNGEVGLFPCNYTIAV